MKVRVKSNANKTEILEERRDFIKVAIKSPAKKGKANRELLKFLKKEKGWRCKIVHGLRSKDKIIEY